MHESVRPLRDRSGLLLSSLKRAGTPLSGMTLTKVLRDTGLGRSRDRARPLYLVPKVCERAN